MNFIQPVSPHPQAFFQPCSSVSLFSPTFLKRTAPRSQLLSVLLFFLISLTFWFSCSFCLMAGVRGSSNVRPPGTNSVLVRFFFSRSSSFSCSQYPVNLFFFSIGDTFFPDRTGPLSRRCEEPNASDLMFFSPTSSRSSATCQLLHCFFFLSVFFRWRGWLSRLPSGRDGRCPLRCAYSSPLSCTKPFFCHVVFLSCLLAPAAGRVKITRTPNLFCRFRDPTLLFDLLFAVNFASFFFC